MKRGFIYNFISFAVRLFVRRPGISGLEHFEAGRDAMIVANHEGAWGPVVTRAWFPLPTAPWVNWQITRRGRLQEVPIRFLLSGAGAHEGLDRQAFGRAHRAAAPAPAAPGRRRARLLRRRERDDHL